MVEPLLTGQMKILAILRNGHSKVMKLHTRLGRASNWNAKSTLKTMVN